MATDDGSNRQPPLGLEVVAALLVPAATLGFVRVFADSSAILPLIGAALLSTATAAALRRARVPLLPSLIISLAALFVLLATRYAPGTARFGIIPTRETLETMQLLVETGLDQFRELRAPVESTDPFIAAAMAATWLMAFLTDWGALRLRLAFEPVLPAGLLFVFSAVLGSGVNRVGTTIVFVLAVILWAVTQRTYTLAERGVWLTVDRRRGPSGLARAGLITALVAMVAGIVVGPRLPGAEAEELYSWRNQGEPTRVVVSPYANIGSRLVTQQDVNLFTVTASRPAYWRLAGLDTFNGEDGIWQTKGEFQPEDGGLPGQRARAGTTVTIEQTFQIEALSAIWLPAAFAPANLVESDVQATWNSDEAALTVDNQTETSDGISYTIESVLPLFTPDELNAASPTVPAAIAERYLGLPENLTPRVADEAAVITAGATTRYEQMILLQNHFQTFDYNIRLGPRGEDPIETFLNERVGFCQQFSGTFALMARSLGAPARVAVGFTWGDPIADDTFQVTGRHTHAWPEVWFEGLGWVAFEPTPGRGAPDAAYTNIEPRQDSLVEPDDPGSTETAPNAPLTQPELEDLIPELGGETLDQPIGPIDTGSSTPWRLLALIALVLLYLGGVPLFRYLRRARRRQSATDPRRRIDVAWADAVEDLERGFELQRRPSETRREFAVRVAVDRRVPAEQMTELSRCVTEARFAGDAHVTDQLADRAEQASTAVSERVHERVKWYVLWRRDLDPRRVLRPTARVIVSNPADAAPTPAHAPA